MKQKNLSDVQCRHCRFYEPEGRRGGCCQKLGATVDAAWSACCLASFPFEKTLEKLDSSLEVISSTLATLEEIVHLETALSLPYEEQKGDLAADNRLLNYKPKAKKQTTEK